MKAKSKRKLVDLILNSIEPPHKNPVYFIWKLVPNNRNIMMGVFIVSLGLCFILPGDPSAWRGLLPVAAGITSLAFGFLLKYFFLTLGKYKPTGKLYEVLMDHDEDSTEGGSFMFFVALCQAFFMGSVGYGIYTLLTDLIRPGRL